VSVESLETSPMAQIELSTQLTLSCPPSSRWAVGELTLSR